MPKLPNPRLTRNVLQTRTTNDPLPPGFSKKKDRKKERKERRKEGKNETNFSIDLNILFAGNVKRNLWVTSQARAI